MSDDLARITEMAQMLDGAARRVDRAEQELVLAKAAHQRLERDALPDLMTELGLREITLLDRTRVSVVPEFDCGITAEHSPAALAWLRGHGFGGLIKTEVAIAFGRDEQAAALQLADELRALTTNPVNVKAGVHFQTLKAFIKEQRAAGTSPPEDLFGIFPYSRAKLTQPKKGT